MKKTEPNAFPFQGKRFLFYSRFFRARQSRDAGAIELIFQIFYGNICLQHNSIVPDTGVQKANFVLPFSCVGKELCCSKRRYIFGVCLSEAHFFCTRRKIKMFKKNDRYLQTANTIVDIFLIIAIIACVIMGIGSLSVSNSIWLSCRSVLVCFILGPLFAWVLWILIKVYLTHVLDVKMIRDKLYRMQNTNAAASLPYDETTDIEAEKKREEELKMREQQLKNLEQIYRDGKTDDPYFRKSMELNRLKIMLEQGFIDQETYQEKIDELLK